MKLVSKYIFINKLITNLISTYFFCFNLIINISLIQTAIFITICKNRT